MPKTVHISTVPVDQEIANILWGRLWAVQELSWGWTANRYADSTPGPVSERTKETAEFVLSQISDLTNLTFVLQDDADADIGIVQRELEGGFGGWAYYPSVERSLISFDSANPVTWLVYHEILHSMGLLHPEGDWPVWMQNGLLTSMYPNDAEVVELGVTFTANPTGLLALDIEALQDAYGANMKTAGNSTYVFDTEKFYFEGLFDAGGTDTIRIEDAARKGVTLDLMPGGGLDVGTSLTAYDSQSNPSDITETVHTTRDTVIERVILGDGADKVVGNDVGNFIVGHGGIDTVLGGDGDDTVWGGSRDDSGDYFNGGAGNDILGGGIGDDLLVGGTGQDVFFGGTGNDTILGGEWDDTNLDGVFDVEEATFVTPGAAEIWAGAGDDFVRGTLSADVIGGGAGEDDIVSGAGNDTLYAGSGDDRVLANTGKDIIFGGAGNDTLNGGTDNDTLYGGVGDDRISGWTGNDVIYGGAGNDTLIGHGGADAFYFGGGHGDDRITDFDPAEDTLYLVNTDADFLEVSDVVLAATEAMVSEVTGVLIDTGGGNSVFLVGLTVSDLSAANIEI